MTTTQRRRSRIQPPSSNSNKRTKKLVCTSGGPSDAHPSSRVHITAKAIRVIGGFFDLLDVWRLEKRTAKRDRESVPE